MIRREDGAGVVEMGVGVVDLVDTVEVVGVLGEVGVEGTMVVIPKRR